MKLLIVFFKNGKSALIYFILITSYAMVKGQELPKNLLYANENLIFKKLYVLGSNKLLYFADAKRQNKRFVYLLDNQNLVGDTMQVYGNDYFLIKSDSTFTISGLGSYGNYKVANNSIRIRSGIETYADFSNSFLRLNFIIGDYLIGTNYHQEEDCSSYHYVDAKKLEGLATLSPSTDKYGFNQLDTLLIFNMKKYQGFKGTSYDKNLVEPLFDKNESCLNRMSYPFYGWLSASLDQNTYTFYERKAGKVFSINVSGEPKLIREFELPLKEVKKEGWKYLFDFKLKKHYAVKRIDVTEIPEGLNKRKARKIEKEYSYELYELIPRKSTFELKPLYKLQFDPVLVDNDLLYEIIQESKKGSAIFFHPLDPNYKYEKSTYLDYGGQ